MACAGCERRRAAMHALMDKAAAHARRLAGIRKGEVDAKPAADVRAEQAKDTEARAKGGGQTSKPSHEHEQRGVEAYTPVGAGKGRPSVQGVQKARGGKGSAR